MKATVIISSYNRPSLLEEAVISVLTQDYQGAIEIIIVDDNSDEVSKLSEGYLNGKQYNKFMWPGERTITWINSHKHDKWRRETTDYARNINTGILASTGDVIFYLVDDDLYLKNHVSTLITFLETHEDVTFVFGNQLLTENEELANGTLREIARHQRIWPEDILPDARCNIDHNQFAHRANAIQTVGLWPEHKVNYGAGDAAFFKQVLDAGYVFYNATPVRNDKTFLTTNHRLHNTSVQAMMIKGEEPKW